MVVHGLGLRPSRRTISSSEEDPSWRPACAPIDEDKLAPPTGPSEDRHQPGPFQRDGSGHGGMAEVVIVVQVRVPPYSTTSWFAAG